MDKKTIYKVIVYDIDGNKVDEKANILAWNRREAYFEVMNKLKPHRTWDTQP